MCVCLLRLQLSMTLRVTAITNLTFSLALRVVHTRLSYSIETGRTLFQVEKGHDAFIS